MVSLPNQAPIDKHVGNCGLTVKGETTMQNTIHEIFTSNGKAFATLKEAVQYVEKYYQKTGIFISIGSKIFNSNVIEAHRKPTKDEIKRGYGCIHHLTMDIELWIKPDGNLKEWTVNPYDGLRYYR